MSNKKQWIVAVVIVGTALLVSQLFENKRMTEINNFMGVTEGEILEIYRANLQSTVKYVYTINGKKYYASDGTPDGLRSCIATKACIGKKYRVEYSTKNPNKSRLATYRYLQQ